MGKLMKGFGLISLISILTGCATTARVSKEKVLTPEKIETLQLSPLALEILDETPGKKNQKFIQALEEDLKQELSKNEIQLNQEAENTLKVAVTKIYSVGFAKRYFFGPFAGQTTIETDVVLIDRDSSSLAEFQVTSYGGMRGAIFELDSPQRVTKKLAKEIVSRLKSLKK